MSGSGEERQKEAKNHQHLIDSIALHFAGVHKEDRTLSLDQFGAIVISCINDAFGRLAGEATAEELKDHLFYPRFKMSQVAALNGTLPLDYPFIIAIAVSERLFNTVTLQRSAIPSMHDNLTPDIVPLIRVKGDANPKSTGEHLSFDRISLDYIGEHSKMPKETWDPESPK